MKLYISIILLATFSLFSCKYSNLSDLKIEPQEELFLAKHYPEKIPNYAAYERALHEAKEGIKSGSRSEGSWEIQGPSNIGARINTIAIHPNNEQIIFAGFADGGLWKTSNGGKDWKPVFDAEIVQSIGSICFDPINPNTLFVGTGDPNVSGYPRTGGGVYKSEDLGNTWKYVGLKETNIISRITIHKSNPNVVFASAMGIPFYKNNDKGVYKSTDYGNTWKQILFINDSTGVSEIVLHPTNQNIIYAIGWNRIRNNKKSIVSGPDAKIWRSKDGGSTWEKLINGLPEGPHTRMGIAIAESNPKVLYAQYTSANDLEFEALYKSEDGGDNWSLHTKLGEKGLDGKPFGGFGWYFGKVRVNPIDENDIFILGVNLLRYDKNFDLWNYVDFTNDDLRVHADKHDLIMKGNNIYLATDGGLYKSKLNAISEWEDIENIPTTQFYRTAYDPHRQNNYWGGAQDNGTSVGNKSSTLNWERVYGGDGFQMAFHPEDDQIIFAESQRGNIVVSKDNGANWRSASMGLTGSRHWDMQYIISSHNPNVMYTGTDKFFKNINGTDAEWKEISPVLVNPTSDAIIHQFTTVSESPIDSNILYCGTSDGMVWNTLDGGLNWNQITNGIPNKYVSSIKASPSFKNTVYVTFTGYKDNDNASHIYMSNVSGTIWNDISGDLPSLAINDVLVYPNGKDNVIFVATDGGIYFTKNRGSNWERLGNNMPLIPVFDIEYDSNFDRIIGATFARGIQTFDLKQISLDQETSTIDQQHTIKVFPNVSPDLIHIYGIDANEKIILYNINGEVISKQRGNKINLQGLPCGMYILKVKGLSKKVIKI
jgi:photosystem II stability/assembly factor-like uncharacterized protein